MPLDPDTALGGPAQRFPTTRPSLLHQAAHSPPAFAALAELYWKPVYKHLRLKWRLSNDQAKDLTQSAFAELLAANWLSKYDPARGTFRTYLRTCVDGLVLHQHEAASRLKRGGHLLAVPLDFDAAERELALADPAPPPDEVFEREWQRQILALALHDLRTQCAGTAHEVRYQLFAAYDLADPAARPSYDELAERHQLPITQVTNHLAWARRELRRLATARINATSASPQEARTELRNLFG